MSVFFWNLFLALAWAALKGRVTLSNLIIGFALGYLILLLSRRVMVPSPYFGKVGQLLGFVLHFLWDLIRSNLRVAHDVLTPRHYMRPGVIAVPLDARTDLEILALANRITLTPGTVSLDVSTDRRTLYVHVMYMAEDADATRAALKQDVERRLLEVLR